MSSVFTHALTGASIGLISKLPAARLSSLVWLLWLMMVAIIPDIDYLFAALNSRNHGGLRITHSLVVALMIPLCTAGVLWWREQNKWQLRQNQAALRVRMLQVILAGSSHLIMDLLVGVTHLPILWPLGGQTIRLPFGILPSAGRLWPLSSYYVYHNLVIELGVMVPLLYGFFLLFQKSVAFRWRSITVLWFCSSICMYWASTLSRPKG
jgi:inner membrane protein